MAFTLPKLSDFQPDKKQIAFLADKLDVAMSAKERWAAAARDDIRLRLEGRIAAVLQDALDTHYAIEGDPEDSSSDADWQSGVNQIVRTAFAAIPEDIVSENLIGVTLWDEDVFTRAIEGVAEALMPEYEPMPGSEGKYLSALGITAFDYDVKGASEEVSSTLGVDPMKPTHARAADVTSEELAKAYRMFRAATDVNSEALAHALQISRPTLSNYFSGRTKPQAEKKHAQVMRIDIERRIAELMEAANIFAKVLS